ncbi:MAG: sugar-binding transcriptional regulator [Acetobacteraceae bacterium]
MTSARKAAGNLHERIATQPAEFDDILSWVVWLYYADQLTQNEIARVLGVSRASIVKLLQEARERGLVTIRINTESASRTRMARALVERFGLAAATVIPSIQGASLTKRLGDAGARVLADQARPGDVIGVAWGRTVLAVARSVLLPEGIANLTVVQLTGSSAGGTADFSPELCSSLLAGRLMARCVNLVAPAVLSTPELRDRLLEEPVLVKQFALIRSATRVLFGVGDLAPSGTVRQSELAGKEVIDGYVERGAVGALIGRFIDAGGRAVSGELDCRMVGLTLDELLAMPVRLCVAGGAEKITAIRAALRGGFVTHLVTDTETGEALLRDTTRLRITRGASSRRPA